MACCSTGFTLNAPQHSKYGTSLNASFSDSVSIGSSVLYGHRFTGYLVFLPLPDSPTLGSFLHCLSIVRC